MSTYTKYIKDPLTGITREATPEEIEYYESENERILKESILKTRNANSQLREGTSSGGGGGPSNAALPQDQAEQNQQIADLASAMKQLAMLHKPAELLKISTVLYYSTKQRENLLDYNAAIKNQNNALDNAEKNTQIYWNYMYDMLTTEVQKEINVIPLNHKGDTSNFKAENGRPLAATDYITLYKTTYDLPQSDKQHIADLYMNYNLEIEEKKIHFMYPFISLEDFDKMEEKLKV